MAVARPAVFCVAFATLPSVLQDLLGGGAGCRGAALTPALVIPLVASLRGAVRSAGHTGAGSGLRYGLDPPRQTEAGSTIGRTGFPEAADVPAGSALTPRAWCGALLLFRASAPVTLSLRVMLPPALRIRVTPYVTPRRYGRGRRSLTERRLGLGGLASRQALRGNSHGNFGG